MYTVRKWTQEGPLDIKNSLILYIIMAKATRETFQRMLMQPKRKSKHVSLAIPPNSSNGSSSPRGPQHSNQLHILVSTPSTAQLDANWTTQSSVEVIIYIFSK